jgi:hypothetical protein
MLRIELRNQEGELIAEIETQEGVVPRVGETVRIESGKAAGDYRVDFVRWNLGEDGSNVQIALMATGRRDLWPDGVADEDTNVRVLFKDKKEPQP